MSRPLLQQLATGHKLLDSCLPKPVGKTSPGGAPGVLGPLIHVNTEIVSPHGEQVFFSIFTWDVSEIHMRESGSMVPRAGAKILLGPLAGLAERK